jgi:hypothetical protein
MGTFGFTPGEHFGIASGINAGGGYGGDMLRALTETAKAFALGQGVSEQGAAGYMGTIGSYTTDPRNLSSQMEKLRDAFVKANVGGRTEEFMGRNLQLLSRIAESRGGELDARTRDMVTAMQVSLWQGDSPVGKGQSGANMIGAMDDFIKGGGKTKGEQVMLWQALGGNRIKSSKDLWEFEQRKERGIENSPEVLEHFKGLAAGDKYTELNMLRSVMPHLSTANIEKIQNGYSVTMTFP